MQAGQAGEPTPLALTEPDAAAGHWRRAAWAVWSAVAVGCVTALIVSLPGRYLALRFPADPALRDAIAALGISPRAYAVYNLAIEYLGAIGFFALAGLIAWRRPASIPALGVSANLIAFGAALPGTAFAVISSQPIWRVTPGALQGFGWFSLGLFALLFPDGHFAPRFARALVAPWALWALGFFAFAEQVTRSRPLLIAVSYGIWVALLGLGVCAQAYRYFRISSEQQRQQTKWVTLGFAGALMGGLLASVQNVVSLATDHAAQNSPVYEGAAVTLFTLTALLIPLSIAIAILRHNLYDIDRLLNLTLVYGSLTLALALLYGLFVTLSQVIFRGVTGQHGQSSVVIVLSTLAIAALFQPLRRRIQRGIDRRFFRRRYDAGKALAAFNTAVRNEVDLTRLTARLTEIVERTMEPTFVSLWLASSQPDQPDHPDYSDDLRPLSWPDGEPGSSTAYEG